MDKRWKINIVLDTNVIFNDWFLENPNIELLRKFLSLTDSRLIIPKIVTSEILNKYREEIIKILPGIEKINVLLLPSKKLSNSLSVEEVFQDYKFALSERFKTLKVEEPDHSSIPHEDIVTRDLERRRPFQNSGKGYRDTLLWEVILRDIANPETETYLISDNYHDFGCKDTNYLHENLQEDLRKKGLSPENVSLYRSLPEFMSAKIKPVLDPIKKAMPELMQGIYKEFNIYEWFRKNRESIGSLIQQSMESVFHELRGLEDLSVSYVEDPNEIKVNDVYELDINQIYIDAFTKIEVVFDVFVFKADYYGWVGEKYDLDVIDYDWNDHYIYAQIITKLPINFALNFNIENRSVDDFEVNIDEIFGFCPNCSEPIMNDAAENCGECGKSFF